MMEEGLARLEKLVEKLQLTTEEVEATLLGTSILSQKYVVGLSEVRVSLDSLKETIANLSEQLQEIIEEDDNG